MYSNSKSSKGIKTVIAPWVLPTEEIPINIELPKSLRFDEVIITIPKDFKFVHFFNIVEVSCKNNVAIVQDIIKTKNKDTPTYFGFVVSSNEIPDKLKTSKKILIEFKINKMTVEKITLNARIFRPMLEITDIVEKIELTDDQTVYEVPMNMKYIGFGDIKIKIEGEIQGRIVSKGEPIVNEVLRRLYLDFMKNAEYPKAENNRNLQLEDVTMAKIRAELEEKIFEGDIEEIIEDVDREFIKQYFESPETKNEFLKIVYTRLEDILINLLTEILDKHPTDNVMLAESQTNITTKIDSRIDNIITRVLYKDKLDNMYPPVEIPIEICDKRIESTKTTIKMPMIIKKWEEEPFMNVAEMEIEEDE